MYNERVIFKHGDTGMSAFSDVDVMSCIELIQERIRSEILKINFGGCAVFAGALAQRLDELGLPVRVRIVCNSSDAPSTDLNTVEETIKEHYLDLDDLDNWNDNGVQFSHVMVEWNGMLIDGECSQSVESFLMDGWIELSKVDTIAPGDISIEATQLLAAQEHGWNFIYDRSQNDQVFEIIDECFSSLVA
jgi:hypothetical protein